MSEWRKAIGLAAAGIALVGPALAQDKIPPQPRQAPDPPPSRSTQAAGRVQSVEGNLLTLTDGRQLIILPGLTEQHGELKPGANIKASYAETAGRKVVTSIQIEPTR